MRGVYRRGINVAEAAGGIKHYFSIKSESGAVYIYRDGRDESKCFDSFRRDSIARSADREELFEHELRN